MTLLTSQLECCEYLHGSDYWGKQVAVIEKNLMAILITVTKGINVTHVVGANGVPQMEVVSGTLETLDEIQGIQQTRMLVEWRRNVLFQQLDLSGLEG